MKRIILFVLIVSFVQAHAQNKQVAVDAKMNLFVNNLMKKMTIDEKIGQLNLPGSGDIVTGQAGNSDIGKKIKEGSVGGLFNIKSIAKNTGRTKGSC